MGENKELNGADMNLRLDMARAQRIRALRFMGDSCLLVFASSNTMKIPADQHWIDSGCCCCHNRPRRSP